MEFLHTDEKVLTNLNFPGAISYRSNKAAGLHCTYLAIMILLNCTLLQLSGSDAAILQESKEYAAKFCQSYAFSERFSPFGNLYMKFALQAAHIGNTQEHTKARIRDRLYEMAATLQVIQNSNNGMPSPETPFDYLKW